MVKTNKYTKHQQKILKWIEENPDGVNVTAIQKNDTGTGKSRITIKKINGT